MLEKNIKKAQRKHRKTWVGLYTRKTKTKKDLLKKIETKYKKKEV